MFNNCKHIKGKYFYLHTSVKIEAYCESVDATTYITIPDSYTAYTKINKGTATFTFDSATNRINFTSSGTAYIEFSNAGTIIDILPLCEAPRKISDSSFLPEMRSRWSGLGERMSIVNSQGFTRQDTEFYTHFYGVCTVDDGTYIVDVPNLFTKNKQTFLN